MAILIGGILAVIVGAVWSVVWCSHLFTLLAAVVPPFLIVGGAIAIYFGIDEIRYPPPKMPGPYEPKEGGLKGEPAKDSPQPEAAEGRTAP
jgi:hypothetical protein